jgi:hypothetical protein
MAGAAHRGEAGERAVDAADDLLGELLPAGGIGARGLEEVQQTDG